MQLSGVTLRRYRGFYSEATVALSSFTVLTGPNNLGKSTVLAALDLFFRLLARRRFRGAMPIHLWRPKDDYPKQYKRGRKWSTVIMVNILADERDRALCQVDLKRDLPSTFSVRLEISPQEEGLSHFDFGLVGLSGGESDRAFLDWFANSLSYVYISATRSLNDFKNEGFSQLIQGAVAQIQQSRKRVASLQKFYDDVSSQIAAIEGKLTADLTGYLPSVRSVRFSLSPLAIQDLVSIEDVEIDDGALTSLRSKGDGFKSVFALSILQHLATASATSRSIVFAIEEPESHLHSNAVYEVKARLEALSKTFQTIITTHSAVLIQRQPITANILVTQTSTDPPSAAARSARTLAEIRQSLGIRHYDNLSSAETAIVVEGVTEERSLPGLLTAVVPAIGSAFGSGRVRIIPCGGASKVNSVIRALARDVASYIVLLDNDQEGNTARNQLIGAGLIDDADLFQVPLLVGHSETEYEDLFPPSIYFSFIAEQCGVPDDPEAFLEFRRRSGGKKAGLKKWSDTMERFFTAAGKSWPESKERAKSALADALCSRAQEVEMAQLLWAKAMAQRVERHLSDAAAAV